MTADFTGRLAAYARMLRDAGAIRTDPVADAFAAIRRDRCVTRFHHFDQVITVPQHDTPDDDVLDLIYSTKPLRTHTGATGGTSSSSGPALMAKMLEALHLEAGMRVLEIGAGTGYNAALIAHITGAPVVTVEADPRTAAEATESIHRLGLDKQVTVICADGFGGDPDAGVFDRIVVTCGIAGIPTGWMTQLASGGLILAPVAHGGVHPICEIARDGSRLTARPVIWGDFMAAAGPLRPAELFAHDPDQPLDIAGTIARSEPVITAMDTVAYNDLWFHLAAHDGRTTRAWTRNDTFDPAAGMAAVCDPDLGVAWAHTDGTIAHAGDDGLRNQLADLMRDWDSNGRRTLGTWTASLTPVGAADQVIWRTGLWK